MRAIILVALLTAGCQTARHNWIAAPVALGAAALGGLMFDENYHSEGGTEGVAVVSVGLMAGGVIGAAAFLISALIIDNTAGDPAAPR